MKRLLLAGVLTLALTATGVAIAGGWATVQLSSTPSGLGPGDPWNLDITVLQHGNPQTPVLDATPRLTIEDTETGAATTYEASPTNEPGVYHVRAVFPEAGVWSYRVYDGFGTYGGAQWHTFAPVTIGEAAAPSSGSGSSVIVDVAELYRTRERTETLVADCLADEPEWMRLLDLVEADLDQTGELSLP